MNEMTTSRGRHASTEVPAILCQDVVRIFATEGVEVQALQGLNLRVESGELIGIVGESGSGKSTLLSILSGSDRPTAGTASVGGYHLSTMNRRSRVRYQRDVVGIVWQQAARNLLPYLSAAENLAAVLALGSHRKLRRQRTAELLDLLGVADCADRRPALMSGGQQQRVAIAVALANSPQVLLADEPTGELDEANSTAVLEAVRSVNQQLGVTVVIVTHDMAVAEHVSRTIGIRDGRTATEVLRREVLGANGELALQTEEFAVLDRAGRLQLPADAVARLALTDRVRLTGEPDHLGVWPGQERR